MGTVLTMRSLALLVLGLGLASAATLPETLQEWSEFKSAYSKQYESEEEDQARMAIYLDNKKIIAEHNALHEAGEISWSVAMNGFGDLTEVEFKEKYLGKALPPSENKRACDDYYSSGNAPA